MRVKRKREDEALETLIIKRKKPFRLVETLEARAVRTRPPHVRSVVLAELKREELCVPEDNDRDDYVYDVYEYDSDDVSTRCVANSPRRLLVGITAELESALSGAGITFDSSSSLSSLAPDTEDSNAEDYYANDYPDEDDDFLEDDEEDDDDAFLPLGPGYAGFGALRLQDDDDDL
ncbi:hypothetical protein CTAYLR_004192 [Chrysophaeum taylorii]|uniref:Transcription factor Iwr1 domain-containing protein n=1 Tax=Chrysophaeum taylorii TaxID=2483200 RepID=A0AAD7XKC6_9STRA|nr:hypothetical protein CTAYLR_004192 [Chrysophaeum taylorii]